MKLPFRGRPAGDDEYDYDDEDEEFDPVVISRRTGSVLGGIAPPSAGPHPDPSRRPYPEAPPSARTPRPGVPPPVNPRRVGAPPPAPRSERVIPVPVPAPAQGRPAERGPAPFQLAPTAPGPTATPATEVSGRFSGGAQAPEARRAAPRPAPAPREKEAAVSAEEFSRELERIQRVESGAEQRSAWAYLGLLSVLFVLVVGFGYGCSGRFTEAGPIAPADMLNTAEPVRLVVKVEGDLLNLSGAVPDQASLDRLRQIAADIYGEGNVANNLSVDPATTFDDGTLRMIGQALTGDDRPKAFQKDVLDVFDLDERGYEVGAVETVLKPAQATVSIDGANVTLSGALPDAEAVSTLTAIAGETWGTTALDATALTTGESTWDGGQIRLAGTVVSTEPRVAAFSALVAERIGNKVVVDTSGLAPGDAPAAVATAQTTIETLLASSPIKFAPDSAEIDTESDAVLVQLAAVLRQVPNTALELVGHTDSKGDDARNLQLSEDRAKAVMQRLIDLGVLPTRLTARGEGESNPLGDNATDEGRALNRRIDFNLQGANATPAAAPAGTTSTTG
ncbi:MAG: OmpA family protein [Acidimicrobiia bacterium]|nr:OmpA family protein [Acidimicrobiia bacterium]